jgi:hypothetical protein
MLGAPKPVPPAGAHLQEEPEENGVHLRLRAQAFGAPFWMVVAVKAS